MPASALVVDDSRAIRRAIGRQLQSLGFTVSEAGDGQEALRLLASGTPADVALVDWNMPVMDGLELIRALRADPGLGGLRIVVVTTETELDRMVTALEAGADEYLMKPFTAAALQDKLALVGLAEPASS